MNLIGKRFRISFSGELKSYLKNEIEHDRAGKTVYLSQSRYIEEMIAQFDIPVDKYVNTPMQKNLKLLAAEDEILPPKQSSCDIVCYIYPCAVQLESYFLSDQGASAVGQVFVQHSF